MWLLILVLVFAEPGWPEGQPRPIAEYVVEFSTQAECEAEMNRLLLTESTGQPPGWDERWEPMLMACEPVNSLAA